MNWQRTTRQRPGLFLAGVGLWLTFLSPPSARAVDEETAKTIADLKAQVQSLVDEVKKLKDQVAQGTPPPARLNPAVEDPAPAAKNSPPPPAKTGEFDPQNQPLVRPR